MRILGLGDHVIDVYRNHKKIYPGGNALNVAVNATYLRYESAYLGVFGDDVYSDFLREFLHEKRVDISMCEYKNNASTKQVVEDVYDGERQFSHTIVKDNWAGILSLNKQHIMYIDTFDVVFTSCNAKMENQISLLEGYKGILVYDFGEKEKYRQSDYMNLILPNIDIAQFSMNAKTLTEIEAFVHTLPDHIVALITRGSEPTLCYQGASCFTHSQTKIIPVDTMGAGDAYTCAFATSLVQQGFKKKDKLSQTSVLKAMELASAHAAMICGMHGGFESSYSGLQAVIFDMDGVLVDSEKMWLKLFRSFLKQYNHTLSKEDEKRLYGCSKKDEDRILYSYFQEEEAIVHGFKEAFITEHGFTYSDIVMPGSKELLQHLYAKGIKLVIASSSPKKDIERMIHECCLEKYFDFIVSGEMFEESKPNPQIYEYCVEVLGMQREHILVIEDSAYGVEAASRAQLAMIHFFPNTVSMASDYILYESNSHEESWKFIQMKYLKKGEDL